MKVLVERGIDNNGNNFCNTTLGTYRFSNDFYTANEYSALIEKRITIDSTGTETVVVYGDAKKIFPFMLNVSITTLGMDEIKVELSLRRNAILNWINSLPYTETFRFEI